MDAAEYMAEFVEYYRGNILLTGSVVEPKAYQHNGDKFQALLVTIELVALGGVCQPIKYVLFGSANRTGSFGPIGRSTPTLLI